MPWLLGKGGTSEYGSYVERRPTDGAAPAGAAPDTVCADYAPMRDGPAAGLALIQDLNKEGELAGYQWLYAAQADLHRRLGQAPEAQAAYRKALSMSQQEPERRYLERRLQELEKNSLDVCRIWRVPND